MKFKKLTNNKWFKKLGLPLLVLLFLILMAAVVINLYFSPVLSAQLKKTVFKLSNGLYQAEFTGSSIHVIRGRIIIDHLTLKPDTAVFNRLKKAGKAPNNLYTLSVDKIVLKHIHPFKLYFKKELDMDEVVISNPAIQAIYQPFRNHDLPDSSKKTFYQRIAGTLKSVHVGQILFSNTSLRSREETDHQVRVRHLKEIDLKATDMLIDSASQNDKSRFNFCKDITVVFNNYSGQTDNRLYNYKAKAVTFSSSKSSIKITNAVFMPQKLITSSVGKAALKRSNFEFTTDSVRINHFDYQSFISYRNFIASDITVFGGRANIFYNRTLPKIHTDSSKSGLYTLLKNVRKDMAVQTLRLEDIDVIYTEISAKTKLRGAITFERLNGYVHNILTGKDTLRANRNLTANLTANLMGYGKLNINLHFDPANPANILYYKGSLAPMNLVNLNPATKTLGLIQFTNGIVTSLNFDMQADATKATGTVAFLYRDLNVVLLKQDEKNALRRMSFISILANAFVLIRNNPTFNSPPRVETVVFERPENTSYLGLLWRSVYAGIKGSIGLSAEIEHNLRRRVEDYKQNKDQREINKAARQERRQVRRLKRQLKEAQDY
ncbi:hypothetical protein [Mucilaginibacter arboris]|uniref:DUF748 domain-containing protein n=1 Tax=Mucilaginibacter arboris TaxID=2682090 RepID=A0A7K1SVV2_9SPHI|nr:hypothetical protein [Mucilaginibacter arboris]MVN21190.1 hypothetical protein [Mucilaginibacter arboris]